MNEQPTNRQRQTIAIPARDFNSRLSQLSESNSSTGALFSRLALIHQLAKAYAVEAVCEPEVLLADLEIEEITDPPLYGYTPDDDPVIVHFSY
ncbi:hypothetical protein [Spirosoma sp.]|uniref:hypothetical protein n=1 Tax=Spirosoma sp. TaxID=1899569 RepID=UPI003B3BA54B